MGLVGNGDVGKYGNNGADARHVIWNSGIKTGFHKEIWKGLRSTWYQYVCHLRCLCFPFNAGDLSHDKIGILDPHKNEGTGISQMDPNGLFA